MSKTRLRGRAALTCVVALACASAVVACDSVLDIEDPMVRPSDGGEPSTGGTASVTAGSATTPEGGAAGEAGSGGSAGSGGEGGDPTSTPGDCETDSVQCAGDAPQICDESGHWAPNTAEASGDCPIKCWEGQCVECLPDDERCAVCEEGDPDCTERMPQTCQDGVWKDASKPCDHYCDGGACKTPTSCEASAGSRGICNGVSCCQSLLVPGGTFVRSYDAVIFTTSSPEAKVSAFYLDKFEVTVGRMKQFLMHYDAAADRMPGDGKAPHIATDVGWSDSYQLPSTAAEVLAKVQCENGGWPVAMGDDENRPVTCVDLSVAYAFCIWDGGRLPTDAEWNFAAAGGSEQRTYPWKAPVDAPITPEHAYYAAEDHLRPTTVGIHPKGDGRWGHSDLAGNVFEWTLDAYREPYSEEPCNDCLDLSPASSRMSRGGSFAMPDFLLAAPLKWEQARDAVVNDLGFRCARDLE